MTTKRTAISYHYWRRLGLFGGREHQFALTLRVGLQFDNSKCAVAEALLEEASIFIHLDPRHRAVRVPGWLRSGPQLVLQVGYSMAIPIPDLRVDEDGIFATLSFQRSPFTCWIPWEAVFAVVSDDGKGMMWPEDLPEEISTDVDREFAKLGADDLEEVLADYDADPLHAPSEVRSSVTSRPLRLIDSSPPSAPPRQLSSPTPSTLGKGSVGPRSKQRTEDSAPHLRLVK